MRCKWCNEKNPLYVKYHDEEWGVLRLDEPYLLEMLILESFVCGLSWECILNKRANFRKAFDNFELEKIVLYDEEKIALLINDKSIIRSRLKIRAAIKNAQIFKDIQKEYGSFKDYLLSYFKEYPLHETGLVQNALSDKISFDLKKRGMRFFGSVTVYSYLQAIGLIDSHDKNCFKYHKV